MSAEQRDKDVMEDPRVKAYLDELHERLPFYGRLASAIPAEEPGSIEWLGRIGKFLWTAREQEGLTRYEIAQKMGVDVNSVRFVETGYGYPELDLVTESGELNPSALEQSEFPRIYAQALGKPELYEVFRERFNLPQTPPPQS